MLRYRRYRVFVVFAVIAVLAIYHFGSGTSQVDYLKQQLSFHTGGSSKQESSSSGSAEQAQEIFKGGPPPPVNHKDNADTIKDSPPAAESKYAPPPVKEPSKPKQHAPPDTRPKVDKTEDDFEGKGPVRKPGKAEAELPSRPKSSKAAAKIADDDDVTAGKPSTTTMDEDRVRVLPNPIPADAFEKVHPADYGEGRWDNDQLPLDAPPVYWKKPKEHFPINDTDVITMPTGKPKKLPKIQAAFEEETAAQKKDRLAKQDVIKEAFVHAWTGYKQNAWGHDEIKPVNGEYKNPFNGWGATLVDSLDIIWMMGLKEEFEEAVKQVGKINFKTSRRNDIPLFETTIRYLGGLLGAYDVSGGKYRILLDKAAELAEILIGAFDTPNRMPDTFYQWKPDFASQAHRSSTRVVLAELGSLALEFTRLAQLTKEPRYYDAIARITDALEQWQDKTRLPGMWPAHLDASGCEKKYLPGPSVSEIAKAGGVQVLDSKGTPIQQSGAHAASDEPVNEDDGLTGKGAVTTNRDDDELEGVDKKRPIKGGASKDAEGHTQYKDLDDTGIRTGRISGFDDIHKEGKDPAGKPKLPPPKKQGSSEDEFIPLERPDPVVFNVKGGNTKQKRQLHDLDAKVAAEKGPTSGGLSSYGDPYKMDDPHVIPPQLPTHKHDEGFPSTFHPPDYSKEECIPQGLTSQTKWGTDDFTLGSLADSTYEYLPKMHLLLNGLTSQYKTMYEKAADAAKEKLLFRHMIPNSDREILVSGQYSITQNMGPDGTTPIMSGRLKTTGSHLTCFVGGMFAMGSKLFDRKDDLEIAKKLTDGCVYAYEMTATGIMPETFNAVPCDDRKSCPWNETKWWEALDPDLGDWRMKNYEANVKFYETQVAMRESFKKDGATPKRAKSIEETLADIDMEDGIKTSTSSRKKTAAELAEDEEFAAVRGTKKNTIIIGDDDDEMTDLKRSSDADVLEKRQLHDVDSEDEQLSSHVKPGINGADHGADFWEARAHQQDIYEAEQAAKQIEIAKGTYDWDETMWKEPSITQAALPPLYSPTKPLNHEQFVKKTIEEDRIPPGIQSMGDRRYILRYAYLSAAPF